MRIVISITPGSYNSALSGPRSLLTFDFVFLTQFFGIAVARQLNDKERVAAAMENKALMGEISRCLKEAHLRGADLPELA